MAKIRTFSEGISIGRSRGAKVTRFAANNKKKPSAAQRKQLTELDHNLRAMKDLWGSMGFLVGFPLSAPYRNVLDNLEKGIKKLRKEYNFSENPRVPQGNNYHCSRGWY